MGVIGASVCALLLSQRQHNQKQEQDKKEQDQKQEQHRIEHEKSQKLVNETKKREKDLEFIKQLEYYDTELVKVTNEFSKTTQKFENCVNLAKTSLIILERISYLRIKKLINHDFIQFFEPDFNGGCTLLNWIISTNLELYSMHGVYPNFEKIIENKEIDFDRTVTINHSFYYYVNKCSKKDPHYKPLQDSFEPKTYITTYDDIALIKPKD